MRLSDLDTTNTYGKQIKVICPLCVGTRHDKTNRSLSVNLESGAFKCHHCGEEGRLEEFTGQSFANNKTREYVKPDATKVLGDGAINPKLIEYMKTRGLTEETVRRFGVTMGPSFPEYDDDRKIKRDENGVPIVHPGIRFPYFENGELVFVKHYGPKEFFEDGKKKYRSFKGGKPVPFGYDMEGDELVLTEGELDTMSVSQVFPGMAVWSVPVGANGLGWLEFPGVVEKLKSMKAIYIAVDQDEEGIKLRQELIRRLGVLVGKFRLNIVKFPMGCKDANELLIRDGSSAITDAIAKNAEPIPMEGISLVDEFVAEYMDFYTQGMPKGTSTGIPALDEIYRVMDGMLTIMTGVTNHGKSEIMDEIVRCMIEYSGWKFAFYTPENSPIPLHMMKLAKRYIGKDFDTTAPNHMSPQEAAEAAQWMYENIYYINPRDAVYSIDEILERARVLLYRYGINGLIIDPWNHVRKDFNGLREDQYINQEIQKIQTFCKETGIHTWLTVHPRTLRKDSKGNVKTPTVHDLSGGSKFGDNSDFILCVERFPTQAFQTGIHEVVVHCQKSRYRPAAQQGNVSLEWNPINGRFSKLGEAVIGVPAGNEDGDGQDEFDDF